MPTTRKIFTVQNLTEKLKEAKAVVLADYQGLNMTQMAELRQTVKKAGGEFEVIKNTLLGRAVQEAKVAIDPQVLTGPTAALWSYKEDLAPLKALIKFVKEIELPKVKFGLWQKEPVSAERITYLASLPTKPELIAKLMGTLKSPTRGLSQALKWNLYQLVSVLRSVTTDKSPSAQGEDKERG